MVELVVGSAKSFLTFLGVLNLAQNYGTRKNQCFVSNSISLLITQKLPNIMVLFLTFRGPGF